MSNSSLIGQTAAIFATLVAAPAHASPQRVHAITIAFDDLPQTADGGFMAPSVEGSRGMALGETPFQRVSTGHRLASPARDAVRFEEFLATQTVPALQITLVPADTSASRVGVARGDPTLDGVRSAFAATRCNIAALEGETVAGCEGVEAPAGVEEGRAEDVVFVHFSGHGAPTGIALRDGLLPAQEFESLIDSLDADLVVVTLDSCYASGYGGQSGQIEIEAARDLPRVARGRAGVAVFKSASTSSLLESLPLKSGMLTHIVLSGLAGGADADRDLRITFAELADYFWLQAERSGQFLGRPEAPGAHPDRVLLDLRDAQGASPLTLDAQLGGRVLWQEQGGGVLAEANVSGRAARRTELLLPAPGGAALGVYFLGIDEKGRRDGAVFGALPYDPVALGATLDGVPSGAEAVAASDPLATYLVDSQENHLSFSEHHVPFPSQRVGRMVSLTALAGIHPTPAFGRIEDEDLAALDDGQAELVGWLEQQQVPNWSLAQLGVAARFHPIDWVHVEARADVEATPSTEIAGEKGSLFLGRGLVGAGASHFLGSRSWLGYASGGPGVLLVENDARLQALSVHDPSGFTIWGALGATTLRPFGNVTAEVAVYDDRVGICTDGSRTCTAPDLRHYPSFRFSLGLDLGRWSL